jgi:hypothetical protein
LLQVGHRVGVVRPGRSGDVGELVKELVQRRSPVVDCGLLVVGERDGGQHALGLQQEALEESFGV